MGIAPDLIPTALSGLRRRRPRLKVIVAGRADFGEHRMARIAVGGFQHETNTFAPQRATWADFERADAWPGFVRGAELIDAVPGYNIPIAGAVEALRARGHELLPLCW